MKEYTNFSEEFNKLCGERQAIIKARASQIYLEELTLKYLQEKLGLSLSELAEHLEVQQSIVPRLKQEQNLELNTLREVVNALGGTVEIIVKIPNKEPIIIGDYSETKCN
ncbi:hypothetical protein MiTe_00383 [Microcystis aeruginosa NIES-2520]|jgi:plasmid maintenance system antidote protein VapI|uniref:HTH cro/C1-type domain-containing protein n=4 Tax=Microcystis aeruginosa TaxID=1126 RepID=A0A5A5RKC4_MICAE|nr:MULTISPECIES: helix-turn-helix transcriptional regulator [Microcystis]MDJ0561246.1 helix-turn-helix transcriptional regulator [Microcystis sp. M53599_WE4]NCR75137.1 XRE family transcriptional regulator [Microcystis aeruginosa K13-06]TRT77256.1 MAG: XRE family transcriptional regulator [Microcystis aeruginosa Ma_AC_P_19900807_S299]MCA2668939.1 XRE family transcriptional regulator [Microcystis sp. M045S2]MCA2714057.1 XRE family transcriptional regulator [Microcystis sp. M172S2]